MQAQDNPLFAPYLLFPVSINKKRQYTPVNAAGRLDDVREKFFLCFVVEILQLYPGGLGVLPQVIIGPVGYALEF